VYIVDILTHPRLRPDSATPSNQILSALIACLLVAPIPFLHLHLRDFPVFPSFIAPQKPSFHLCLFHFIDNRVFSSLSCSISLNSSIPAFPVHILLHSWFNRRARHLTLLPSAQPESRQTYTRLVSIPSSNSVSNIISDPLHGFQSRILVNRDIRKRRVKGVALG